MLLSCSDAIDILENLTFHSEMDISLLSTYKFFFSLIENLFFLHKAKLNFENNLQDIITFKQKKVDMFFI